MAHGAKLLIVDDEYSICRFLEISLGADYFIFKAHTGMRGMQMVKDVRPDVVILDLELPDSSGFDVLKKIRAWSGVPVIVLTVRGNEADKVALLEAGADDYLTKPFSITELKVRIRGALRHASGQKINAVFELGPLKINFDARMVLLNECELKLTATEYDILKLLAQHAGKVVTQRHLMREIWGPEAIEHTHYLRIYIAQLRRKLSQEPSFQDFIVTEPGVGYRLRTIS